MRSKYVNFHCKERMSHFLSDISTRHFGFSVIFVNQLNWSKQSDMALKPAEFQRSNYAKISLNGHIKFFWHLMDGWIIVTNCQIEKYMLQMGQKCHIWMVSFSPKEGHFSVHRYQRIYFDFSLTFTCMSLSRHLWNERIFVLVKCS